MKYFENILQTIGNTPLVKLNTITKDLPCTVLAKVETTSPGNSIKDRMALKMIEDAENVKIRKPKKKTKWEYGHFHVNLTDSSFTFSKTKAGIVMKFLIIYLLTSTTQYHIVAKLTLL